MLFLLLIIFIVVLIYIFLVCHLRIKVKTFFHKGFKPTRGLFGVYCYCGKQGSGKTYSVVEYLLNNKDKEIYSNVHLEGIKYTYFNGFNQLLDLRSKSNCIIVYDEIFTALTRSTKI